jgi:hypothetical protein
VRAYKGARFLMADLIEPGEKMKMSIIVMSVGELPTSRQWLTMLRIIIC